MQHRPVLTLTITSAGAVSAHRFVTPGGAQAGADGNAIGVTQTDAAAAGAHMPVVALGTAIVEAGAAISAGATVKSDAQGRAIAWATSGARLGIALTSSSAAGQFVEVLLIPNAA
jgi:hypothetical protein